LASSATPDRPKSLKEWVGKKGPAPAKAAPVVAEAGVSPVEPPVAVVAEAEKLEKIEDRVEDAKTLPEFDSSTYDRDAVSVSNGIYTIAVEAEETLSHIAEWSGTSAARIRALNKLRYGQAIRLGQ